MMVKPPDRLAQPLAELAVEHFTPRFEQLAGRFADNNRWRPLARLGTELWLDSGDIEAVGRLWTRQFSAITTNNTLLAREVAKGQYDGLVKRAAALIRGRSGRKVDHREIVLEAGFVLNARHALRLVEAFDARVSVELHTDLADDIEGTVRYARRLHAICPQRFYVKVPLTAAGLIAARRCHEQHIPINLTLGFSARQNYLAARLARPAFVNVFLGRLNSLVADNGLGTGRLVGEKATLASQRAIRDLRRERRLPSRQIAASIRGGDQLALLAGVDVMTIPPSAAEEFLKLPRPVVRDRTDEDYPVELDGCPPAERAALRALWEIPEGLAAACDELDEAGPAGLTAAGLLKALRRHGLSDLLVRWTASDVRRAARDGKIPRLANWGDGPRTGRFGVDALMNLAGLCSFASDQAQMDARIRQVLGQA